MTLFKEETMLVHPVVVPGSGTLSWTVLGDDDVPVVPVDRFLAYLTDIGRSPNTVKAYAHDLKDYWSWISLRGLDWREAGWRTSGSSSRGCSCQRLAGPGRSRYCRRQWLRSAQRR
jgi:hypothetical protein